MCVCACMMAVPTLSSLHNLYGVQQSGGCSASGASVRVTGRYHHRGIYGTSDVGAYSGVFHEPFDHAVERNGVRQQLDVGEDIRRHNRVR